MIIKPFRLTELQERYTKDVSIQGKEIKVELCLFSVFKRFFFTDELFIFNCQGYVLKDFNFCFV